MICVDSSALVAIILREPLADRCAVALAAEADVLISAATLTEALIVATGRGLEDEMSRLIESAKLTVIEVTKVSAIRAADAHRLWGKGRHRAGLNYGDCFSYELASRHGCPLLYIGNDFSKTDIESVL